MAAFNFDPDLVRQAMRDRSVSQERLAQAIGLSHRSAVPKIFRGERKVTLTEAAKIYDYLGLAPTDSVSVVSIPIIGLASAGRWREAVDMPIGRMTLPQHIAGNRAFAVEVIGDSMDKLIEDGGWIAIDPDDKVLSDGKCYLLQNGEHEVTVKMYRKGPPRFEPVSSNPEHESFLVSDSDPTVLGRVVWKGSRV